MGQKFISDNTVANKCSCCGRCCQDVLYISQKEKENIQEYINLNKIQAVNRNSILENKEQINICPFLNNQNLCNIYDVRPQVCKNFLCNNFCQHNKEIIFYLDKEVISMIQTFFPDIKLANPYDLTFVKERFNNLKNKIRRNKNV